LQTTPKVRTPGGKLKVRELFKATLFAYNSGIAINFGRIYRFVAQNGLTGGSDPLNPTVLNDIMLTMNYLLQKSVIFYPAGFPWDIFIRRVLSN